MKDIKTLGDYEAVVHFHKEVEVAVPVKVVSEDAKVEETPVEEVPAVETPEEIAEEA